MSGPRVFRLSAGESEPPLSSRTGTVGRVVSREGLEAVLVSKKDEAIDLRWFSQPQVDLIVVLRGRLRVEFERPYLLDRILGPGDCLVLPGGVRCRAYRWPRTARGATRFLAVYPTRSPPSHRPMARGHRARAGARARPR
jgi:quercetin dioxygenase-like cupin family protein